MKQRILMGLYLSLGLALFVGATALAGVTVNVDGQTYQCTATGSGGGGGGIPIVTCVCGKDHGPWGNENVVMNRIVKEGTSILDSRVLKRFPFISGNVADLNKQLQACQDEAVAQPLCFK